MMIGGEKDIVKHLDPIFACLAPGIGDIPRTPGRDKVGGTSEQGYCIVAPMAATSSRWSTTASNTASWLPMPKASESFAPPTSASRITSSMPKPPLFATRHYQYDLT